MILPFGWRADRGARNRIITLGIAFWSLMTAACGLARNFTQLFVARMGVGVGEATLAVSVTPLISDYFPRQRRTLPLSIFSVVGATGTGIAYLVGGAVSALVMVEGTWHFPLVGELRPWQAIFMVVGLPGLVMGAGHAHRERAVAAPRRAGEQRRADPLPATPREHHRSALSRQRLLLDLRVWRRRLDADGADARPRLVDGAGRLQPGTDLPGRHLPRRNAGRADVAVVARPWLPECQPADDGSSGSRR